MLCISDKPYKQVGFLCLRSVLPSGACGYLVGVPAQLWISDPPVQCVIPQGLSLSAVPSDSVQYVSNTLYCFLTSGTITVDGHDIRQLNPLWFRTKIGTVSQVRKKKKIQVDEIIS